MAEIVIESVQPVDGRLSVRANITDGTNSWSGPHLLDLPDTALDAEIKAALLALYGLAP